MPTYRQSKTFRECGVCEEAIEEGEYMMDFFRQLGDRSQRTLIDGSPVTEDHRELRPNGQQKAYVVLSLAEREKGFVRPFRDSYRHVGSADGTRSGCYQSTTMGYAIAATYARDPGFYGKTFCCQCCTHLPVDEFIWKGDGERVGS